MKKRNFTAGCYSIHHKPNVSHYVDYDYLDRLPLEAKEWLGQFSDEYYGDKFPKNEDHLHSFPTKEAKKAKNLFHNARRRDIMSVKDKLITLVPEITDDLFTKDLNDDENGTTA